MKIRSGALAAVLAVSVLSGCADDAPAKADDPPSSETATSASPAASDLPAYTEPESCVSLELEPEKPLPGATVAKCWSEALYAHGSMRAFVSGPPQMEGEIVLRPEPKISTKASDGDAVIYVDDTGYSLEDGHWIKGDPNSKDRDEAIVGAAAAAVKGIFTPAGLSQGFSACPTWQVDPKPARITVHDGTVYSDLVHLTCTTDFEVMGATVTDAGLWIEKDWTPISHIGTASVFGTTVTTTQEYYDHGSAFDITAPTVG